MPRRTCLPAKKGEPLAAGFFVVGDAAYHTNPLYGRGTSQAFLHARLLGEALDAAAGDAVRAGRRFDEAAREEIEPFYYASVAADHVASRKVGAGRTSSILRLYDSFFVDGVLPATRVDPLFFRTFVRVINMMDAPERAFFRPETLTRVLSVWLRGGPLPEAPRADRAGPRFDDRRDGSLRPRQRARRRVSALPR